MLPRIPTQVQVLDRGRNSGEKVKNLGYNRTKEVLACLGRFVAEIEVVVEVRNALVMRVPLETTDSSETLIIEYQLQNSPAFVTHQRTLFPLPAVVVKSMPSMRR